ncbi:hypothetical protein E3Q18_01589 [Wallemia mellicola]|nr:hypothetical protein E3Q18_01589 [Wallemia mellicola]
MGTKQSPLLVGGGQAHGPRNTRNWKRKVNKKVWALGMKVALSDKIRSGELVAIPASHLDIPRTNKLSRQLSNLGLLDRTLFVSSDITLHLASRNIPTVDTLTPEEVDVYDVLRAKKVVVDVQALNSLYHKIQIKAGEIEGSVEEPEEFGFETPALTEQEEQALLEKADFRLKFSAEVLDAMATRKPVVALESTIITHGLPRGDNLSLGRKLEKIIRDNGAIPAHIAVIDGHPLVGLSDKQLEILALDESLNPLKISRRDLAVASALNRSGGTTVAGTICLASAAGIKHFCTGGLGGVHRGAERTWDVSADLTELGRSPVNVICAGAKSILDTSLTLEYLETQGVTVATVGETNDFPAFYSPKSGYYSPYNLTPVEAARVSLASDGLSSGALFCCPIPAEYAEEGARIQSSVDQAIKESQEAGIAGKETTPWLLARVAELTKGSSIKSNLALIENNAKISADIAVAYNQLQKGQEPEQKVYPMGHMKKPDATKSEVGKPPVRQPPQQVQKEKQTDIPADVMIIGASALDITSQYKDVVGENPQSTYPGVIKIGLGGVGRNIAEATNRVLRKSPISSMLVTPVGSDEFAETLKSATSKLKMRTDGFINTYHPTPVVNLLLNSDGELREGVSSFEAVEKLTFDEVKKVLTKHKPQLIALDGNLNSSLLADVMAYAEVNNIDTLFEPTSVAKATRILSGSGIPKLTYATPNIFELKALVESKQFGELRETDSYWETLNGLRLFQNFRDQLERNLPKNVLELGLPQMSVMLLPICKNLLVKCGSDGVLAVTRVKRDEFGDWKDIKSDKEASRVVHLPNDGDGVVVQHFKASVAERIVNTTGAGDSFVGALIAAVASRKGLTDSVKLANEAAMLTLGSQDAVSARLNYLSDDLEL